MHILRMQADVCQSCAPRRVDSDRARPWLGQMRPVLRRSGEIVAESGRHRAQFAQIWARPRRLIQSVDSLGKVGLFGSPFPAPPPLPQLGFWPPSTDVTPKRSARLTTPQRIRPAAKPFCRQHRFWSDSLSFVWLPTSYVGQSPFWNNGCANYRDAVPRIPNRANSARHRPNLTKSAARFSPNPPEGVQVGQI